jgi:dienelactone hydrolase
MNTTGNWGFYSAPAEAHLQSVMGLHTLNSIRSLDFILGLPEVDPSRVAITGASGGATQVLLLAAVDPRLAISFPAVMVSTAMQGGCTCENASLLRVGTGNVEIAGLFAPKPQGMTTANDWTREMATRGFPELKQLYELLGAPANVMLHRGEHFPHNYNAVSRSAFYTWLNQHFKLGWPSPVVERDYERLARGQLTVWNDQYPAPKASGDDFERSLCRWLHEDSQRQLEAASGSLVSFRRIAGGGVEAILGRTMETTGRVQWVHIDEREHDDYLEIVGLLRNRTHAEELPVIWLYPKRPGGRAVVWLEGSGKDGLFQADGTLKPEVRRLVDAGAVVLGADLILQGEFLAGGREARRNRLVANPREFAGYTYGYNHTLFAQRVHDVLGLVKLIRGYEGGGFPRPTSVDVVGFGEAGPIVAAARAVAREDIDRAVVETRGWRFGELLDYREPGFLPGGAKYGDLPGMLALGAPGKVWIAGEAVPELTRRLYEAAGASGAATGAVAGDRSAAVDWLLAGR